MEEFHYRIGWRTRTAHPGHHGSLQTGGGSEFCGYQPFQSQPDPRNLDMRATLADPLGRLMVKAFRQHSAVPVYLVADLSASMGFSGIGRKPELLADLAAAVAYSAYRTGDPFGFLGCTHDVLWDLALPLRWHKGLAHRIGTALRQFTPTAPSARGLAQAAPHLGTRRALVFLVSDFHFPLKEVERILDSYVHHDVVPVVLWDSGEFDRLPAFGLAEFSDPETGSRRRLLLRPTLRQAIRECYAERREQLTALCRPFGRTPFFLIDRFDADALTDYFFLG
jgi:uncharacterized protein (DUF58 family)